MPRRHVLALIRHPHTGHASGRPPTGQALPGLPGVADGGQDGHGQEYPEDRNLLIDAGRAARSRPVTVHGQLAERGSEDTGLDLVLDRQLVTGALRRLSPAHRAVLVETFYCDSTLATIARELGIPGGTARSRLHYGLQALRRHLRDQGAVARR